jgi:hypothetical protein
MSSRTCLHSPALSRIVTRVVLYVLPWPPLTMLTITIMESSSNATIPTPGSGHGNGTRTPLEDGLNMPLLVGLVSTLGSILVLTFFFAILYFLFYTRQGRILLHRGRPGEYDDEQAFLREEEEGLQHMDDIARISYLQSRG